VLLGEANELVTHGGRRPTVHVDDPEGRREAVKELVEGRERRAESFARNHTDRRTRLGHVAEG